MDHINYFGRYKCQIEIIKVTMRHGYENDLYVTTVGIDID